MQKAFTTWYKVLAPFRSQVKVGVHFLVSIVACCGQESAVVTSVSNADSSETRGEETLGFYVVTSQAVDVTALGMYDSGSRGLELAHSVGVWDGGFLFGRVNLMSETNSFSRGDFIYKKLPQPIRLFPGRPYVFGANYSELGSDYFGGVTGWSSYIVDAHPAYSGGGAGFAYPGATYSGGPAYGGPNALFVPLGLPVLLENPNFEAAHDIPRFDTQLHPWFMPATNALPGWSCYIGDEQATRVLFNDFALDSASISLLTADSPYLPAGGGSGQYSVSLQSGYGRLGMNTPASIAQRGLLPPDVSSLRFRGSVGGNFVATFGDKNLPLTVVLTRGGVSGYVADLSRCAGQAGELRITSFNHFNFIDSVNLSKTPADADHPPKVTQDFSLDPLPQGWAASGGSGLFSWSAVARQIEVIWDSSKGNSYFALPLGTTLSSQDSFSIEFDLTITTADSAFDKPISIPIAIGLQNSADARKPDFLRTSRTNSPNLVEFDLYCDTGANKRAQVSVFSTASSSWYLTQTNIVTSEPEFLPFQLPSGEKLHVRMKYDADQKLQSMTGSPVIDTTLTANSETIVADWQVALAREIDFRVDTFAIASYGENHNGDGDPPIENRVI